MTLLDDFMKTDLRTGQTQTQVEIQQQVLDKIATKGYDTTELGPILLSNTKFQLVEAIAGAGKTTVLNFKIIADMVSGKTRGKNIWVNTFLKTGAAELKTDYHAKSALLDIPVSSSSINFSTLHSEFYRVLTQVGLKINIITERENNKIFQKVAKDFGIGSLNNTLDPDELSTFKLLITRARNNMGELPKDAFSDPDVKKLNIYPSNIKPMIREMYNRRVRQGVYDFEDLQDLIYKYTYEEPNPAIINLLANKYEYIYLDEFQDISAIQYEILKIYFKGVSQVFVVGDSDQSIYSWRGSDIKIITQQYPADYNPEVMTLTVNYRVPSEILRPIARSIKHNTERLPKQIQAAREGGTLDVFSFNSKQSLLNYHVDALFKDQQTGKKVAVLAGSNIGLTDLAILLNLQRENVVDFEIRGNLVNLDAYKFSKYWRLAHLFTSGDTKYLKQNLEVLAWDLRGYKAKRIEELLRNEGIPLRALPPHLARGTSKLLENWLKAVEGREGVEGLLATLEYLREEEKRNKSAYADGNIAVLSLFISMLKYDNSLNTPAAFLQEINRQTKLLQLAYERKGANIILTTPFEFKGKEADIVYILEDTLYNFPRSKSAPSQFEEERRVHYIAGTRARERQVYTTIDGKWGPFLKELEVTPVRPLLAPKQDVLRKKDTLTDLSDILQ